MLLQDVFPDKNVEQNVVKISLSNLKVHLARSLIYIEKE